MGEKTQDDKETQDDGKDVDPTAAESAPKEIDPQDVAQVLTLHAERMDGMFESLSAHRTELDDLAAKANTMLTLANIVLVLLGADTPKPEGEEPYDLVALAKGLRGDVEGLHTSLAQLQESFTSQPSGALDPRVSSVMERVEQVAGEVNTLRMKLKGMI